MGIDKMRHIPNSEYPESIRALHYAQQHSMDWGIFSRSPDGDKLRLNKAQEQKGLCGYCECLLTNGDMSEFVQDKHLDHFYPRNKGKEAKPELQFDWDNLILSCCNSESCGFHKDSSKHNILPSQIINPRHENPEDYITFVVDDGESDIAKWKHVSAVVRENLAIEQRVKAQNTINALNLNSKKLRIRRMGALFSEIENIELLLEICKEESDVETLGQILMDYEASIDEKEFSSTLLSFIRSNWDKIA